MFDKTIGIETIQKLQIIRVSINQSFVLSESWNSNFIYNIGNCCVLCITAADTSMLFEVQTLYLATFLH